MSLRCERGLHHLDAKLHAMRLGDEREASEVDLGMILDHPCEVDGPPSVCLWSS